MGRRATVAVGAALLAVAVVGSVAGCANSARHANAGDHGPASSQAPDPAGTTPGGPTAVTTFSPYSAAGALTVPVDNHAAGECWTSSIEVPVAGAYRCLVGNDIADPCFVPPGSGAHTTVACVPAPWAKARVVTLTQPLPSTTPIGKPSAPWAIQLANGVRCVAAAGTVQSVQGVSLNLLCSGGMGAGGLDTSGPQWRVRYGSTSGGSLSTVAVTAAWRG